MRVLTAQFSRHCRDLKQIHSHPTALLHARRRLFGDVRNSTPVFGYGALCTYHTPSKKISGNDVSKGAVVAVVFLTVLTGL
jgi:hypothetical protein